MSALVMQSCVATCWPWHVCSPLPKFCTLTGGAAKNRMFLLSKIKGKHFFSMEAYIKPPFDMQSLQMHAIAYYSFVSIYKGCVAICVSFCCNVAHGGVHNVLGVAPLHDVALCTEMHGWSGSTDGGRRFAILDVVFCTYCSCLYYATSKSVQNYLTKLLILHIYIHTQPHRCTDSRCSKMHPP